jgi:hypothetical protein
MREREIERYAVPGLHHVECTYARHQSTIGSFNPFSRAQAIASS